MLISIKYVNPPGAQSSGKFGSIVDQNGMKIYVPVAMLGQFQVGTTVDVATKEQVWGTTPVLVVQGGPTGPVQGHGQQVGYQAASQAAASQRANTGFQPRVIAGGAGQATAHADDEKSRNIFVCGVVQQAMNSGKFTASEIAVLTSEANRAFDLIGKPPAKPATYASNEPVPGLEPGDPGPELQ